MGGWADERMDMDQGDRMPPNLLTDVIMTGNLDAPFQKLLRTASTCFRPHGFFGMS